MKDRNPPARDYQYSRRLINKAPKTISTIKIEAGRSNVRNREVANNALTQPCDEFDRCLY